MSPASLVCFANDLIFIKVLLEVCNLLSVLFSSNFIYNTNSIIKLIWNIRMDISLSLFIAL